MRPSLLLVGASAGALVSGSRSGGGNLKCKNTKASFKNLVAFGDSYTDNGRLGYYINNGAKPPPPGQLHPESNTTSTGGLNWAQFAARTTGARLVDYAVAGATCSNQIVGRHFSLIGRNFPAVLDDEIPSFQADVAFRSVFPDRTADNTVYALWIGTNDLGFENFLADSQAAGTTITDYVECVWTVFDQIYQTGGRRFVLLNQVPLNLAPLYALPEDGGTLDSQFWSTKTRYNMTENREKILQYSTNVNTIFDYGVPFQAAIKQRWPKATVSLFDVHKLMLDIRGSPQKYLDAPYNVTGYFHQCSATNTSQCVDRTDIGPLSAFLWYDELHPSERADSIIAQHFLDVVAGKSEYGVCYD